jgi:hypothetical protein
MKPVLLIVPFFLYLSTSAQDASSVINSTGSSYTAPSYQFDWSLGETALIETQYSPGGHLILTNGFLQPASLPAPSGTSFSPGEIRIFPNPTRDQVEINLLLAGPGRSTVTLYDAYGRWVFRKQYTQALGGTPLQIDLRSYAAGPYLLKLEYMQDGGTTKKSGAYKLIKQ